MKFINKHIKLIVFIITLIIIYLIYSTTQPKKIIYTSIGDGFAEGLNPYLEKSYGYSDYIEDYYKKHNMLLKSYKNFTDQNMMIKDLTNNILINNKDNEQNNIRQVLRQTNLLTISVGINDFIYKIESKNIETNHQKEKIFNNIVESLNESLIQIKKYCKGDIYLIGYYNFYPQKSVEKEYLDELNQKLEKTAKKNNINFVDNSNLNNNLHNYIDNPNSFYPNINGYKQIFNNVVENIT